MMPTAHPTIVDKIYRLSHHLDHQRDQSQWGSVPVTPVIVLPTTVMPVATMPVIVDMRDQRLGRRHMKPASRWSRDRARTRQGSQTTDRGGGKK